jgi:carbon starvation protein CstA
MKKLSLFLIVISCVINSYTQEIKLTTEQRMQLMDLVVPAIQNCISNFGGKYQPGTTIRKVEQETETKFVVYGTLSYKGQQCGLVSNTDYYVTVYQEGSQTFGETCIYSPYCLWGIQTSIEWDCDCKKWQYNKDNAAKGAVDILRMLQTVSR